VAVFAIRVPLSSFRRGAIPIILFLMFTFISNVLFLKGETVHEVWGLSIAQEGVVRGGQLTLRLVILILGARVLTASTKAEELVAGLKSILGPFNRSDFVTELIYTMTLTLQLLPIVYDEALKMFRDIRNSEGTKFSGKIRLSVSLITSLFERSLQKAKDMSGAGESK
jgi:energy-coupling factor transport system permease protein